MKFESFEYQRPNMTQLSEAFTSALKAFEDAECYEVQKSAMEIINQLRFDYDTMSTLASIRYSINTKDAFYDKENDFYDQNNPRYEQWVNRYYKALLNATYRLQLEADFGDLVFKIAEQSLATFDDAIMDDLVIENSLVSKYDKLLASAEIAFDGKILNLSQMTPYTQSKDREIRKTAFAKISAFFTENEDTLDTIYDDLVHVRHRIAKTLGYRNFIELGYARLGRLDYTSQDVANYREQVKTEIVPLAQNLVKRQGARLGIDPLMHYDAPLKFLTGNPTPKGDRETLVNHARAMYQSMSPETDAFFNFMIDRNLMDLDIKKGKSGGGYCTFIPNHNAPFIFANFNGTSHDVDVLTHEAGHAFQVYSSRHHPVPEYQWATMEASEIHSMSMEFFAWPWIESFFKEDTKKYQFNHLAGAISFIPYGVAVDEFQHRMYENPNLTKAERKTIWRDLEKVYMPHINYDDAFLERGGLWFRQSHIFSVPFYYIDYTLAQVCAFQYWSWSQKDKLSAWQSYLKLCQAGGSLSFLGLLELAGLDNPFTAGTVAKVMPTITAFLNTIDDKKL